MSLNLNSLFIRNSRVLLRKKIKLIFLSLKMKLSKGELVYNCFYKVAENERVYRAMNYLESREFKPLNDLEKNLLLKKIIELKNYFVRNYQKHKSHYNKFETHNAEFLASDFDYEFELQNISKGRPKKNFENKLSNSSKCSEIQRIAKLCNCDIDLLLRSARYSARHKKNLKKYSEISNLIQPKKIKKLKLKQISVKNVLNFFAKINLSKFQYIELKKFLKSHTYDILPCYDIISKAKESCYPKNVTVEEFEVKCELKSVLEHVYDKVFKVLGDDIDTKLKSTDIIELKCTAEWNIGADGSSGFSQYHQNISKENSDSNLFASSCTLLSIHSHVLGTIFINPSPASIRFNVPWWVKFAKESNDIIKEHYEVLVTEIAQLNSMTFKLSNDHVITIEKSNFTFGAFDGKIEAIHCGTSTQSCINCTSTPTEMANVENIFNGHFDTREFTKNYAYSMLHSKIQGFNFFLNLGSKLVTKNGRGGNTDEVQKNRELIRQKIEEKLNLIVDRPNPVKGGNFTTGNVARRAFANHEVFAECLGLNDIGKEVLRRVTIMFSAINSNKRLNIENYRKYGRETYEMYLKEFSWHRPSPYFHRLCIHVADIADHLPLPLIFYTEEAGETRNKIFKFDREYRTRKTSREDNIIDMVRRAWVLSDYEISLSHLKLKKKEVPLPMEAQNLILEEAEIYYEIEEEDDEIF